MGGSSVSFADTGNPVVAQFRSDYAKYQANQSLHQWALEGWALGQEFAAAVGSMGANVTRNGFEAWLDAFPPGPGGYTYDGLFTPVTYSPDVNFSQPVNSCSTIEQWSDAAGTFVERAGTSNCAVVPYVSTKEVPDGS